MRSKRLTLLAVVAALAAAGSAALAAIPDEKGAITGCYSLKSGALRVVDPEFARCVRGEGKLRWNQTGSLGPPGPPGPPGPSDAYSVEDNDQIPVATTQTNVLTLTVPAGKYVIWANALAHNMNATGTVPLLCWFGTPTEWSPPYGARIDPFNSATLAGASATTVALTLTSEFSGASNVIKLDCLSNSGAGGKTADVSSRQITAIRVGSLHENDLAP